MEERITLFRFRFFSRPCGTYKGLRLDPGAEAAGLFSVVPPGTVFGWPGWLLNMAAPDGALRSDGAHGVERCEPAAAAMRRRGRKG
jgi:hypothetical protein